MRFARLGLMCVAVASVVSCQTHAKPNSQANEYVRQLGNRIMPQGCRVISHTGPILQNITIRAEWEFETDWTDARYEAWVKDGLAPDYKSRVEPHGLILTRYDGADYQSIEILSAAKSGKLDVHAVFTSYPD